MKTLRSLVVLAALTATAAAADTPAPQPMIGEKAPEFSLKSLAGETVNLADYRGEKTVVMHFGTGW